MSTLALIGLGSNLGDRKATLDAAIAALRDTPGVTVRAISSYHETAPIGGPPGQGRFLNAAAALETSLEPTSLHRVLLDIEARAGRDRTIRWGERTLDLDLLLFGDLILDTPELTVPHPRMAVRRFVLAPLAEIAPETVDPLTGWTIAALLANLDRRPSCVVLQWWPDEERRPLFQELVTRLSAVGINHEAGGLIGDESVIVPNDPSPSRNASRERRFVNELERMVDKLRLDRWSANSVGERWIVTDFWIDFLFPLILGYVEYPRLHAYRQSLRAAREQVVRPTFVVAPPLKRGMLPIWVDKWVSRQCPIYNFPMLRTESESRVRVVDEILAACAASRLAP